MTRVVRPSPASLYCVITSDKNNKNNRSFHVENPVSSISICHVQINLSDLPSGHDLNWVQCEISACSLTSFLARFVPPLLCVCLCEYYVTKTLFSGFMALKGAEILAKCEPEGAEMLKEASHVGQAHRILRGQTSLERFVCFTYLLAKGFARNCASTHINISICSSLIIITKQRETTTQLKI